MRSDPRVALLKELAHPLRLRVIDRLGHLGPAPVSALAAELRAPMPELSNHLRRLRDAGLGIDREHEEADRAAGRRIGCPLLFACSIHDDMEELYGDPVAIWRDWADDVRGARIDSGHHMAEEAPEELAAVLGEFLA